MITVLRCTILYVGVLRQQNSTSKCAPQSHPTVEEHQQIQTGGEGSRFNQVLSLPKRHLLFWKVWRTDISINNLFGTMKISC